MRPNVEYTIEKIYAFEFFYSCKWPNIEKIIQPSGHTEISTLKIWNEIGE